MRFVPAFTVLQELNPTAEMALAFEEELKAEEETKAEENNAPRLSEEDVRAAYEDGYDAGLAAAEAEFADELEKRKEEAEAQVANAGNEWMRKFGAQAATGVMKSLAAIREEVARDTAAAIMPFLSSSLKARAVESLSEAMAETVDVMGAAEVIVTGPQEMIDALKEHLPRTWQVRERVSDDVVELTAQIDSTVLTTRIGDWLKEFTEPSDG